MSEKIQVKIGGTEKRLHDIDDCWVNQQINRRQAEGQLVCVQVSIECDRANMRLSTPTCGGGYGGGRMPNALEKKIFDNWERFNLNTNDFNANDVHVGTAESGSRKAVNPFYMLIQKFSHRGGIDEFLENMFGYVKILVN
jgi:hypothetical protein